MSDPQMAERTIVREPRFRLVPFDEISVGTRARYLVKGLIPAVGLVVVWGPPKCGKSFWVLTLMLYVALGWEYLGRRVKRGPVVYLALEGAEGFTARIEAFRLRFLQEGATGVPFHLLAAPVNLIADHKDLIASIATQLAGAPPAAVVIDTLNRSLVGSESSDEDMTAYHRAADSIRDAFGCAVVIVHHCGVEGNRPRGHTSLTGAADAQLAVKRDDDGRIVVEVQYMKDGPEGAIVVSRLETVDVGTDEDGDAITSCVVEPVDGEAGATAGPRRKLSDKQRRALDALTEAVGSFGQVAPTAFELPGIVRAVDVEKWREELFSRGVLEKDAKNPRADFKRIKDALAARHLIGERDGLVWRAD